MANRNMEDAAKDMLEGGARANALDFIAFLRGKGIPLGEGDTYWDVSLNGENVCFLWIDGQEAAPGPWTIWSDQMPDTFADAQAEQGVRETAWANVNICGNCGGCDNVGGTRKRVLGREFDHLCNSTLAFTNPDADALDCAKRMMEIRLGQMS